jgi:uncharacterized protein (TIGR02996 family)
LPIYDAGKIRKNLHYQSSRLTAKCPQLATFHAACEPWATCSGKRRAEMRVAPKAEERARREFFPEEYARAMQLLSSWQTRACAPGERPSRMHDAVLNLARGTLTDLKQAIADAKTDFRDVLLWGEYGEYRHLCCVVCQADEGPPVLEEEAFLTSIAASPPDNIARLVYADWLEEHGDPRADYLRLLCAWLACRSDLDQQLIERERNLRLGLDRRWLARIRGMPVREMAEND